MPKVLYTSDLHGNEIQYRKLFDYAIDVCADIVIIGGDIAPRNFKVTEYIVGQREFLQHKLPAIFRRFKKKLPDSKVFLMMGNDDCSSNLDVLKEGDPELYQIIHGRRLKLSEDIDIVGYSFVPITPFGTIPIGVMPLGIKDWEKFDLSNVPARLKASYLQRKASTYQLKGFKSTKIGLREFTFSLAMEKNDSIQKDLSHDLFTRNPDKTVYVIHTPPDNTNLDLLKDKNHVGSIALRGFIEKYGPYLTLHGHIHETVDVSGDFKQQIGNTLSMSSGNYHTNAKLAVLIFDLYNPQKVQRKII